MKQDGIIHRAEREAVLAAGEIWKSRSKGIVNLQVHWVPGHSDFAPNEKADEEAKKAAQGDSSNAKSLPKFLRKRLPLSVSALRQEHLSKI
jgi:ribonuclease HI